MRLVILYGSQTGTAQDVAENIWRESRQYGCTGPVLALNEFDLEKLQFETTIIFVVATTGQGDEPDNMRRFWRFLLRRSLPNNLLAHLSFACLGLGDSSYVQFNFAAKKLNKRLQQLGAMPIKTLGLCDDQHDHGLGAVALPWITELFETLAQQYKLKRNLNEKHIFKWQVVAVPNENVPNRELSVWPSNENPINLRLTENTRTTAEDHFQDVRLLNFAFPNTISWQPGDVLQLRPSNRAEQVATFFELMEEHNLPFHAQTILEFMATDAEMPLPNSYSVPVRLEDLVSHVWDLNAVPRQRFFELLALNCTDDLELEKLQELSTAIGLEDYISYVQRPRRTALEVLQDFRQACSALTLPVLCELFSHIQPRSYSIASAVSSNNLQLLVAVVEYRTKLSTPRLGLCSNWLKTLSVGTEISGLIKKGTLKLPVNNQVPLIMIGPGTGIAPFRSVIQQRLHDAVTEHMMVFFGCRNKHKDYHFSRDLENWKNLPYIDVFVAFSRDQPHKVYVQHLIEQHASELKELICEQEAIILVAGSSNNMPKCVKDAFLTILDNNKQLIDELVKSKRYQEETWS